MPGGTCWSFLRPPSEAANRLSHFAACLNLAQIPPVSLIMGTSAFRGRPSATRHCGLTEKMTHFCRVPTNAMGRLYCGLLATRPGGGRGGWYLPGRLGPPSTSSIIARAA